MVGVPRFELGSKRPKRPSIGQTNPYARYTRPRLTYYQLHSRNCQIPSLSLRITPCASALSRKSTISLLNPNSANRSLIDSIDTFPCSSINLRNSLMPKAELNVLLLFISYSDSLSFFANDSRSSGGVLAIRTFIRNSLGFSALSTTGVD